MSARKENFYLMIFLAYSNSILSYPTLGYPLPDGHPRLDQEVFSIRFYPPSTPLSLSTHTSSKRHLRDARRPTLKAPALIISLLI